jgi:hypothetical protein
MSDDEAKERLQEMLAAGITELTEHYVGRMGDGSGSEIATKVHTLLAKLQSNGMLPDVNLDSIKVRVHRTDPTKIIVDFPPELTPIFEEANRRREAAVEASHETRGPDRYGEFHKRVYSRDTPQDNPHGWIQWKGTDVCMDVHCECGAHGHIDDEFAYFYRCAQCGATYAVGQVVKLIKLEGEDLDYVENGDRSGMIKTDPEAD